MDDINTQAFISLFNAGYKKCFGSALNAALSETESKHLSNKILEDTGLVIGAKSIKNYSFYVLNRKDAKQENPSVATLDTLARYVLNAPYTSEVERKEKESNYPYWFSYKSTFIDGEKEMPATKQVARWKTRAGIIVLVLVLLAALLTGIGIFNTQSTKHLTSDFHTVNDDSLKSQGWFVQSKEPLWWSKRDKKAYCLTLFTLRGDNWPDSANAPVIKNLLLHKISSECFTAEIHLDSFMPRQNWQQAGILLMEDTAWAGRSTRLSIAYNDFFGGYNKPGEIIIQAITSEGNDFSKPEEIAHLPIFSLTPQNRDLVDKNLQKASLKIEKNGHHFRFLYSAGPIENLAFKEIIARDLLIKPKYIGIFALQGFVKNTDYIPAHFTFFSLVTRPCE